MDKLLDVKAAVKHLKAKTQQFHTIQSLITVTKYTTSRFTSNTNVKYDFKNDSNKWKLEILLLQT